LRFSSHGWGWFAAYNHTPFVGLLYHIDD